MDSEQKLIEFLKRMPDKESKASLLQAYIQDEGPISDKNGEVVRRLLEGEDA